MRKCQEKMFVHEVVVIISKLIVNSQDVADLLVNGGWISLAVRAMRVVTKCGTQGLIFAVLRQILTLRPFAFVAAEGSDQVASAVQEVTARNPNEMQLRLASTAVLSAIKGAERAEAAARLEANSVLLTLGSQP